MEVLTEMMFKFVAILLIRCRIFAMVQQTVHCIFGHVRIITINFHRHFAINHETMFVDYRTLFTKTVLLLMNEEKKRESNNKVCDLPHKDDDQRRICD